MPLRRKLHVVCPPHSVLVSFPPMPPSSRKELTEADVPPLPPKDLPPAEREQLMKARRKVQEQLRDRTRNRSQRARPPVEVATTQRELLRALKAPEIAVAAIEAAEVPITYAQMQPLVRMLDQVAPCVHAMCACELCVCGLRRRKGPPLWKGVAIDSERPLVAWMHAVHPSACAVFVCVSAVPACAPPTLRCLAVGITPGA